MPELFDLLLLIMLQTFQLLLELLV